MNKHATVFRSFQTSPTMKLLLAAIVLVFLVEANAQWYKFPGQAVRGQPLDLWHLLLWTKLWLAFLTLTVHDCIQDLMICGEHTGTWGGPTGRTQTNTFMPEETTTLPEEDQGANGPQRWSGECSDLCILSDHNVVLLLMLCFCYSDARELVQTKSGHGASDSAADQAANRWGRNGGNPNVYRPRGLPKKY